MKHKPEAQKHTPEEPVGRELVTVFLHMTPEQRITANEAGIEFVFVGGLAAVAQGAPKSMYHH